MAAAEVTEEGLGFWRRLGDLLVGGAKGAGAGGGASHCHVQVVDTLYLEDDEGVQAGLGGRRWARPTWPACLPPGSFLSFSFFCKEGREKNRKKEGVGV